MYKVGMLGGAFNPLHLGHVNNILHAANLCEELFIVLSYNSKDQIKVNTRYQWIYKTIKHFSHVHILLLEYNTETKADYDRDEDRWRADAKYVHDMIGKPIDVVFLGSDYTGRKLELYKSCYQGSEFKIFDRSTIPISSTAIRENPYANWDYIPTYVRPYFVKKVLITGLESTGKSTLTESLALAFNTNFIDEAGRDIGEATGHTEAMTEADYARCLMEQKVHEYKALSGSNKILFIDTDAVVTEFFIKEMFAKYNYNTAESVKSLLNISNGIKELNNYDLVLHVNPTNKFVQDGFRNEFILNDRYSFNNELLNDTYSIYGTDKVHLLSGTYDENFLRAKHLVNALMQGE